MVALVRSPEPVPRRFAPTSFPGEQPDARTWYRWVAGLVGVTLILHTLIRCALYGNLDIDEAEQLVLVQTWSAGYSAQPPLYTWLLWPVVQLVGANVTALALVKLGVLSALYWLMNRLAHRLLPDRHGALASITPLLLPVIGWEAWRMTHTPLLCSLCLATVLAVLRLPERPGWTSYLALGCCLGLGMLTKYNYALFATALFLACLTIPAYRSRVLSSRILASLTVAALVFLPHGWWVLDHFGGVVSYLRNRTGLAERALGLGTLVGGVGGYLQALSVGLSVALAAAICLLGRSFWRQPRWAVRAESLRLVLVFVGITLALYLGVVVSGGMRTFRVHWFAPILLLVPFGLLSRGAAPPWKCAAYLLFVAVFALATVSVRGSALLLDFEDGRYQSRDHLYAALAADVASRGVIPDAVVTHDVLSAGYARLYFPGRPIYCLGYLTLPPHDLTREMTLLLWDATDCDDLTGRVIPELEIRLGWSTVAVCPVQYVHTSRQTTRTRTTHLGYRLLRDPRDQSVATR